MTWSPVTPLQDDEPVVGRYEQTFHIGQRVRVRLSGECAHIWASEIDGATSNIGHPDEWNGRTGMVVPAQRPHLLQHHPLAVHVDGEPVEVDGLPWVAGRFAACELEAL